MKEFMSIKNFLGLLLRFPNAGVEWGVFASGAWSYEPGIDLRLARESRDRDWLVWFNGVGFVNGGD